MTDVIGAMAAATDERGRFVDAVWRRHRALEASRTKAERRIRKCLVVGALCLAFAFLVVTSCARATCGAPAPGELIAAPFTLVALWQGGVFAIECARWAWKTAALHRELGRLTAPRARLVRRR